MTEKANVSDISYDWLQRTCHSSDYQNAAEFSASNCQQIVARSGSKAYKCTFSSGTSGGLYKETEDNKLSLLCGVQTDGRVYSHGTADTNTFGKILIGAAAIAAVAAVAGSSSGGGSYAPSAGSSCPCPYNFASDGTRCGARSAWTRSGGDAPYCDISRMTSDDILARQ